VVVVTGVEFREVKVGEFGPALGIVSPDEAKGIVVVVRTYELSDALVILDSFTQGLFQGFDLLVFGHKGWLS
jgi:hypothetical protein